MTINRRAIKAIAWGVSIIVAGGLLLSPIMGFRYEMAVPLGDTIGLKAEARDTPPRLHETVEPRRHVNGAVRADVKRTGLCALHQEFCKYRGLYRQIGFPLLILSAIVLPCWLVFRLYRLRTPGHPLSARREILLLTFVVYLLGLAALTLTPNAGSRARAESAAGMELRPNLASLTCSFASLPKGSNAQMFCRQNVVGNVMLFFPLGVLIPLVWRRLRLWMGILIGITLSLSIELIQYSSGHRSADVNDVILNGLGACLGLVLVYLLRLRQRGGQT